jgi:hypothetical protein
VYEEDAEPGADTDAPGDVRFEDWPFDEEEDGRIGSCSGIGSEGTCGSELASEDGGDELAEEEGGCGELAPELE